MLSKFTNAALLVTMTQALTDVFKWSKQVENYLEAGVFQGFIGLLEKDFKLGDDPEVYHQDWRVDFLA